MVVVARLHGGCVAQAGWPWTVELVNSPDDVLIESPKIVVTADSVVLDRCGRWANIGYAIVARALPDALVLDLGEI